MSRLFVVVRPDLARGFHLAGVDAEGVQDVETAQQVISSWLETGETGLLVVDDGLLAYMDTDFIRKMERAEGLPFIAIPGGDDLGIEFRREYRIAEMIKRAIGVRVTFKKGEAT